MALFPSSEQYAFFINEVEKSESRAEQKFDLHKPYFTYKPQYLLVGFARQLNYWMGKVVIPNIVKTLQNSTT